MEIVAIPRAVYLVPPEVIRRVVVIRPTQSDWQLFGGTEQLNLKQYIAMNLQMHNNLIQSSRTFEFPGFDYEG